VNWFLDRCRTAINVLDGGMRETLAEKAEVAAQAMV
jgi:hypothetical protein